MMFITSDSPARSRRLSTMARSVPSRLARARARTTPPTSGDTTIGMLVAQIVVDVLHDHRHGEQIVGGNVEKALDLAGMQIDRQHPVGAGFGDQVGDQLGGDRRARADFAVLAGIAEIGDHGGDAPGEARRSASIMISNSIRLSLAGKLVDWITNMSSPRTFSCTSTNTSMSAKRRTCGLDGGAASDSWPMASASGAVGIAGDQAHAPRTVQIRHRAAPEPREALMTGF